MCYGANGTIKSADQRIAVFDSNSLVFWQLLVFSNCQKTRLSQTCKSNISYAVTVFNSLAIAHIKAQSSRAMEQIMIWVFLPFTTIFR